jgi:hypothetical protein
MWGQSTAQSAVDWSTLTGQWVHWTHLPVTGPAQSAGLTGQRVLWDPRVSGSYLNRELNQFNYVKQCNRAQWSVTVPN